MAGTLRQAIDQRAAADRVVVPPEIGRLLDALEVVGSPTAPSFNDRVAVATDVTLAGFAGLAFDPGGPPIDVDVEVLGSPTAPTGFKIDLKPLDRLALPVALKPATLQNGTLVPTGAGRVRVRGGLVVRIQGSAGGVAELAVLGPGASGTVVALTLEPPAVLVGDSGIGFELSGGLVVDDSASGAPPPAVPAPPSPPPSATPSWRGVAIQNARLHLPRTTPLLGGRPIDVAFELGRPAGLHGRVSTSLPAAGGLPAVTVNVEWSDPAATSLADALPTLVELMATVPVQGQAIAAGGGAATLEGPPNLTLRGRFARDRRGTAPRMVFTLAVEGGGPDGLLALRTSSGPAAKVFITAAALAGALMAEVDNPAASPSGDASGASLPLLLAEAALIATHIGEPGELIVNAVEVEGELGDASRALRFKLDYSVALVVRPISLPPLTIRMDAAVPLRLRYRNVRVEVNLAATGQDRLHLSYDDAELGVEDPGKWTIDGGPGEIFDVIGSRSGRGSTWFEIDLRFALELGPVKVSGATVRATLEGTTPSVSLRGLEAQIALPGIIDGSGVSGFDENGIDLTLAATLIPLQIGALAFVEYEDVGGVRKVLLGVAVDLPGPLPLANTGLGIYGLLGFFVVNGEFAPPPPGSDPIAHLLAWKPWQRGAFAAERGAMTFGIGAVIGTVPDLGYAFSSKAILAVTVPDIAVRASLEATILQKRLLFAQIDDDGPPVGLRLLGALAADSSGVTVGLRATYDIPKLLHVDVPFGARFPTSGNDWFLHLGADGVQGRGPGPIQATVLPGLLDIGGWAFLMVRGAGTPDLGGIPSFDLMGFSVGFGFGVKTSIGAIIRLDLSASAVIGIGTNPLMLLGRGRLQGDLHLGPVSIGVSADVDVQIGPGDDKWLRMEVCGEVDLFFFDLRGCVEIDIGHVNKEIPPPSAWPLEGVVLTDHRYGDAVVLPESPANPPQVWPDAIPILQFSTGPANGLDPGSQFAPAIGGAGPGGWSGTLGGDGSYGSHDLRYTFRLVQLDLFEVTNGVETLVASGLEAAWQLPKHGNPKTRLPGARELALLTWEPHLWTRALPDGGASLATDPLDPLGDVCAPQPRAVPGWALGAFAERDSSADPWHMPPEPGGVALAIRHVSEFEVEVTVGFPHQPPLDETALFALGIPGGMRLGGYMPLLDGVEIAERSFASGLGLPQALNANVDDDPFSGIFQEFPLRADLVFSEPLNEPLIAFVSGIAFNDPERRFRVFGLLDEGGSQPTQVSFQIVEAAGTGLGEAYVFASGGPPGPYVGAFIEYDARHDLNLLGVRGMTATAEGSAHLTALAAQSAAQKLADRKNNPPGAGRTLLRKGTTYKLVVGQEATGVRPGQAPLTFPAPSSPLQRTFWFKTAGVSTAPLDERPIRSVIFKRRDVFDPKYLERYLLGYTPGDHTEDWFTGDLVAAHFHADHIAQLAKLYGRDVLLRCRRSDTPPGQPEDWQDFSDVGPMTAVHLGAAADRRLAFGRINSVIAAGVGCDLPPTGGATLAAQPGLANGATYDLAVAFPFPGQPNSGGALPGIVFSTSRWRNPGELLGALGFGAQPGPRPGDVPVEPVAPFAAGGTVGDLLVQRALARFGLERWPVATAARTTALWSPGPSGWLLSGVLLEAPEPIHRPAVAGVARLTIGALACAGGSFRPPLRDSAGSRILFSAASPFVPAGPLELSGAQQAIPTGPLPGAAVQFTVRSAIGAGPRFAEDL